MKASVVKKTILQSEQAAGLIVSGRRKPDAEELETRLVSLEKPLNHARKELRSVHGARIRNQQWKDSIAEWESLIETGEWSQKVYREFSPLAGV